jgi:glycosyltransferase involved in cell wall biosynthesis
MNVKAAKSVGYWAWELERLPRAWLHAFSFYDEIWASTDFAAEAFAQEERRPVRKVPLAVMAPIIEREMLRSELGLPEDATVFLFMFDFRSYATRKNPAATIEAFRRAFPNGEERAFLLIKTQGAAAMPEEAARLRALCTTDSRIMLRDAKLERVELLNLIRTADAFVSLHRSEGFGRGPAEAMLLGRPAIVTDYSGNVDYATAECSYPVSYELVEVGPDEYPGAEGQRWADADIDVAAEQMRRIHDDPDEARAVGERGRERIRQLYSLDRVGTAVLAALGWAVGEQDDRAIDPNLSEPASDEEVGIEMSGV